MNTDKTSKFFSYLRSSVLICGSLLLFAGLTSGCRTVEAGPAKGYFGPTDSVAKVISDINANNTRLPTLGAAHYFEATIFDEEKKPHFVNGDGVLIYQSPISLRIVCRKVNTIFEIGSNADRFWLKVIPDVDTMWWGVHGEALREGAQIPLRPDLIGQVLGIGPIETNLLKEPAPVMRFNPDADAYMMVWQVKLNDRWIAQREVWYDRKTKLPRNVILFDDNGRVILRALLSKHQGIGDNDNGPKMATEFRLFFPESGAKMSFELSDMKLKRNGAPNARSFLFPDEPGVSKVVRISKSTE